MSREYGEHSHIRGTCSLYSSAKDTGEWLFRLHFIRDTKVEGWLTSSYLQQIVAVENIIDSRKFKIILKVIKERHRVYIGQD
jgi:hypothetical protein